MNSPIARVRLAGELERATNEIALLREAIRIKDARMASIEPRKRPHYRPTERLAILELRAARGWSLAQAARVLLIQPATIASWWKRIDEDGASALVQTLEPVNKYPCAGYLPHPSSDSAGLRPATAGGSARRSGGSGPLPLRCLCSPSRTSSGRRSC